MVKHIVFFKITDKAKIEELKTKLEALKEEIDFVVDLEVGIDFIGSERSFDLALLVDLPTRESLNAYAIHPKHTPIVEWVKANGFESKAVDYEY